jgi:hypothetical protein
MALPPVDHHHLVCDPEPDFITRYGRQWLYDPGRYGLRPCRHVRRQCDAAPYKSCTAQQLAAV